jgi:uncharacterized protein (DUF4415 family)
MLDWGGEIRERFYRPVKKAVTLRLDADVLEWFRQRHPRYQTAINATLREYIRQQRALEHTRIWQESAAK